MLIKSRIHQIAFGILLNGLIAAALKIVLMDGDQLPFFILAALAVTLFVAPNKVFESEKKSYFPLWIASFWMTSMYLGKALPSVFEGEYLVILGVTWGLIFLTSLMIKNTTNEF